MMTRSFGQVTEVTAHEQLMCGSPNTRTAITEVHDISI